MLTASEQKASITHLDRVRGKCEGGKPPREEKVGARILSIRCGKWDDVGQRGQRGTAWGCVGQRGTGWDSVGQRGTAWGCVGQRGTAWGCVGQRGTMANVISVIRVTAANERTEQGHGEGPPDRWSTLFPGTTAGRQQNTAKRKPTA